MDMIIKLAIYAAIAAAAAFAVHTAWSGFTGKYIAQGAAEQLKTDSGVLNTVKADRDQWRTQAENRQAETAACTEKVKTQNDALDRARQNYDAAVANRKAAEAAARSADDAKRQTITQLQVLASAKPLLMRCEDELAKAKPVLVDVLCAKRPTDPTCVARGKK